MDDWLKNNLVCPRDLNKLQRSDNDLVCSAGCNYPIIDGIPIMLLEEVFPTHLSHTLSTLAKVSASRMSSQFIHISKEFQEKPGIEILEKDGIHPYVQKAIAATCGRLYKPVVGKLTRYPIPEIRLPQGSGEIFLDIGSNWGRWSIAAAKKGYNPVGIDPSLDALLAARQISRQLNMSARYIVADARYLPFASSCFDVVFSYSVLQHFSKENARQTLTSVSRVLKPKGTCLIQMPNTYGLHNLYNQVRRAFSEFKQFDVRFWNLRELRDTFTEIIGPTSLFVDGYFGLGIQKSDIDLLPLKYRLVVHASEILRMMSEKIQWMKYFADSIYVKSIRELEVE